MTLTVTYVAELSVGFRKGTSGMQWPEDDTKRLE